MLNNISGDMFRLNNGRWRLADRCGNFLQLRNHIGSEVGMMTAEFDSTLLSSSVPVRMRHHTH
jgi:hypothetical protein